jgi:hypothetical protein
MGFSAKLFRFDKESDTKISESIRAEINISECIDAHMKWKGRLQNYVDGTSKEQLDPMIICRDDQCALGKWIYGPALQYFCNGEGFYKLR